MRKYIMMMAALLAVIAQTGRAADVITVSDFQISAGETKDVSVTLSNEAAYVAFQFDLYLPDGITVTDAGADRSRVPASTTLSMAQQPDGSYRFLAVAMGGEAITGSSGGIVTLTVTASTGLASGSKTGYFRQVKLAKSDATGPTYAELSFPVTVIEPSVVTARSYSRQYGESNPVFDYTVTGGALSGTPSVSCEATASSPVGTYDINITRGSVTNYNATFQNGTLTITKAPLTVKAKSYTIKQGEALPTLETEYAGFKNSETSAVLTALPTLSTTATSASAPGTYDIVVSGAEATNYSFTYVKGTLTVTEADAVTVTARSYSIEYGDALPTFEYTSAGATLSGTPAVSCEATTTSPVGTYPIVITKGTVTNYNDTYVNGTLTITKAPLTVTAKSYTIKQGETLPTLEAEYAGFKNSETSAVLTIQPTLSTTATSASAPGTYDITVSGGEATNYSFTYVKGTLTVTEADGILGLSVEHPADVYDLQGNKVRTKATSLQGLPKGVYVIAGRKVVVK